MSAMGGKLPLASGAQRLQRTPKACQGGNQIDLGSGDPEPIPECKSVKSLREATFVQQDCLGHKRQEHQNGSDCAPHETAGTSPQ